MDTSGLAKRLSLESVPTANASNLLQAENQNHGHRCNKNMSKETEPYKLVWSFGLKDSTVVLIGFAIFLWFFYSLVELKLKYGIPWGQ